MIEDEVSKKVGEGKVGDRNESEIQSNNTREMTFVDFLPQSKFIKPWMLRVMPANRYLQDVSLLVVGTGLTIAFMFLIDHLFGEWPAIIFAFAVAVIFQGDFRGRYYHASIMYREARKNGPR